MSGRVLDVLRQAEQILGAPAGRDEIVALASALVQAYLACMASLLRVRKPKREGARCVSMARAAKILSIPEYTARELGRKGELPIIHFGRDVRVPLLALRRLVRDKSNGLHPRETREMDARLSRRVR